MKRPQELASEHASMQAIVGLTNAYRSLASMRIVRSKERVLRGREFFEDIWHIYSQIRVSDEFRYGRSGLERAFNKELYILVTAEAGLSGDIDQRLVAAALAKYNEHRNDIIVVGRRGQILLSQRRIPVVKMFNLPSADDFDVSEIANYVSKYRNTKVFYQSYQSLTSQVISTIDLGSIVQTHVGAGGAGDEVIDERGYIFEPSVHDVVAYFEKAMIGLTVSEAILDSRLAQDASRFRAMTDASDSATDNARLLKSEYYHARRSVVDQRLREIMTGLKLTRRQTI